MIRGFIKNKPFRFTDIYERGLQAAQNTEAARIKIENAHADLLLFTSKECGMWNTYDGCVEIMDMLRKYNYPYKYDLIVYDDAGEPYYVPYVFPAGETTMKMAPRLVLSMGGSLESNVYARTNSWEKAIEFFKK